MQVHNPFVARNSIISIKEIAGVHGKHRTAMNLTWLQSCMYWSNEAGSRTIYVPLCDQERVCDTKWC